MALESYNPVSTPDWLLEQARRQRLFDAAGIGSWIRSADGSQAIWSPGLKALFGFSLDEEPRFEDVLARVAASYRGIIAEAVRIGRETGEVFAAEFLVIRPDGSERWVEGTAQWFHDANGKLMYVQGVAKDITKRKRDEQRLQNSERRMRALVDSSAELLCQMSADFTVLTQLVDRGVLAKLETPTEDWLQRYIPEEDRPLIMATVAGALRDGKGFRLEHRVFRRDGSIGWLTSRVVPILSPEGRVEEWVGMATDITEAKRLSTELKRHQTHLEDLVASRTASLVKASRSNELLASRLDMACRAAGIAIWYHSAAERFTSWDDRMYELFGLARREGDASPATAAWYRRVHADDRRRFRRESPSVEGRRQPPHGEFRIVLPDGAIRYLRVSSLVDCDEQGVPIRIVGACEDFTADRTAALELQKAKAAADAANLAKSKFIAAASHDLRQPLAAANLYLDILKDIVPTAVMATLVARVRGAMDSLSQMLGSLLDLARLDSRAVHVQQELVPLSRIAHWIREEFADQFRAKGPRLGLRFTPRNLRLRTDETRLKGILRNLLVNALKYTEQGGVLVTARLRPSGLVFQVWDTGIGIATDHLPHIYEEFFQIGNPERDLRQGTGLGLSIVLRAATLLGASISCRSRLGRGTVFELAFPRGLLFPPEEVEQKGGGDSGKFPLGGLAGRQVCLVEDDPAVRDALTLLLATWGMRVLGFAAAAAALASPEIASAEFLITDLRLPGGMNGFELLRELESRHIHPVRSVVLTGEIDIPEAQDPSACPWPILRKPCDPLTLWNALTD